MISLVIPVYNFGSGLSKNLATLRAWLESRTDVQEVIFVDDGSTDGTPAILKTVAAPMRVITLASNQGKGAAVRAGILAARGEYVFFTDVDLPYDLSAIDAALRTFAGGADVVLGSRNTHGAASVVDRSMGRKLSSIVFLWLANRILLHPVADTQCGFKGFRADAARNIFGGMNTTGFAFDVEMIYRAQRDGYAIALIPVTLVEESISSIHLLRDGLRMGLSLLRLYVRTRGASIRRHDLLFIAGLGFCIALLFLPVLHNLGVTSLLHYHGISAPLAVLLLCILTPLVLLVLAFCLTLLPFHHTSAQQLSRYAIVGIFNTALNAAIFNTLMLTSGISRGSMIIVFSFITFALVITQAFFWNMHWTFRAAKNGERVRQYVRFLLVSGVTACVNILLIHIMVNVVGAPTGISGAVWANIALLITIFVAIFGNFFGYKFLVFAT